MEKSKRSNKGCPSCSEQDLEKLGNRNIACDPQIFEPKLTLRPIVNSSGQQLYDIQMNGRSLPKQIKTIEIYVPEVKFYVRDESGFFFEADKLPE